MLKKIFTIFIITLCPIIAQNNIDSLHSSNKNIQEALNYYNNGDFNTAKILLANIIDGNEKNSEVHYYLAHTQFQLKNLDDAIEECERAVELDNNNADYHATLGQLYGEDAADASIFRLPSLASKLKKEAETALKLNSNHIDARMLLANFYFQAPGIVGGSYDKAIEQATIATKLDEWQGRLLLIRIYNKLGKYDEAESECKLLEGKECSNTELQLVYYNEYGSILLNKNLFDEAIKKYKMAVSLAPEKSWTHNILGNAYLQKGQYSEAITEFKNALSINPKSEYAKEKMEDANEKMAKKK